MAVNELGFQTDDVIYVYGPVDTTASPNAAISGATVTAKLFDKGSMTRLSADEAVSQTELSVDDAAKFVVGDTVRVETDTEGTYTESAVNAVDATAGTITLAGGIAAAASAGRPVWRKIGADITLSTYGSFPASDPVPGDTTWGYRGTKADTHDEIEVGQNLLVEIDFSGGAGLRRTEYLEAQVVRRKQA